jgi:hypothetical protein
MSVGNVVSIQTHTLTDQWLEVFLLRYTVVLEAIQSSVGTSAE